VIVNTLGTRMVWVLACTVVAIVRFHGFIGFGAAVTAIPVASRLVVAVIAKRVTLVSW